MESISPDQKSRYAEDEKLLQDLMISSLGGNAETYRRFLQLIGIRLRSFYRRRHSGWPDDVEDLVQDTLLAIHNQRHTYQAGHPVTAWVHAIARYKTIDLLRSRRVREALHDSWDDDEHALVNTDATDAAIARRDLDQLLATLPERQRLPIERVKLEGCSVADVARETGMSESAVKIGIHRGLKVLAGRIAQAATPNSKELP